MVTDAEAAVNGADFAFQNAGGIRIGALEPGDMTAKMVYEMDPFGNEVNVVELTPAEMRDLIRVSHRYNKRRHAVDLLVSGMTYTLYTKNGEPDRIEMAFPDGRPLEEGRYLSRGAERLHRVGLQISACTSCEAHGQVVRRDHY